MPGWTEVRSEDRLPWLETVEPDDDRSSGPARTIAVAIIALVALAAIAFGLWRWQAGGTVGNGELIAAPAGDYKIRPEEAGGMQVEGEGDSAIATSAGKGAGDGAIDLNAVPETPVTAVRTAVPAPAPATAERTAVVEVPRTGGRLVAAAPMTAPRRAASGAMGGSLVQLGAYPSEAVANEAWKRFSERFGYLAALGKSVQPVAIDGRTLYRLRVNAGGADQAADICGRLKVAGEACFVAS